MSEPAVTLKRTSAGDWRIVLTIDEPDKHLREEIPVRNEATQDNLEEFYNTHVWPRGRPSTGYPSQDLLPLRGLRPSDL